MSPISDASVSPSSSPTPGIVSSSATRASARASGRELGVDRRDPRVEQLDHGERLDDRAPPHRRHAAPFEQLDRVRRRSRCTQPQAPLGQQAEDAVHRRSAHPDQMHPSPQPLAQRAVIERRDPQLGHQIAPAQLGQHARVDRVGLARQRRDVADLARVARPAPASPPPRAGRAPRSRRSSSPRTPSPPCRAPAPAGQPVLIGRHRALADDHAGRLTAHHAARAIRPIRSRAYSVTGPSFASRTASPNAHCPGRPGGASFMAFSPFGCQVSAGCRVAAGVGGEDLGEVGEERLFLEAAGDRGGEEAFDGAFAVVRIGCRGRACGG